MALRAGEVSDERVTHERGVAGDATRVMGVRRGRTAALDLVSLTDARCALLAGLLGVVLTSAGPLSAESPNRTALVVVIVLAAPLTWLFDGRQRGPGGILEALLLTVISLTTASLVAVGIATHLGVSTGAISTTTHVWAVGCVTLFLMAGTRWLSERLRPRRALLVGSGEIGRKIFDRTRRVGRARIEPVGFADFGAGVETTSNPIASYVVCRPEDIPWIAGETDAHTVVFGFPSVRDEEVVPALRACERAGLEILVVPRFFETLNRRAAYEEIAGIPVLRLNPPDLHGMAFGAKHVLDRLVAVVALALLSPLLAVIAVAVRLSSPGPILFSQRRMGRDGQLFDMLKFRSMVVERQSDVVADTPDGVAPGGIEEVDRRTRVGAILRATSLDELPQLVNVLRGEMSLVGPRPERPTYVRRFRNAVRSYEDRHRVKSGITGWAQVHGSRGPTSLSERVELDNFYIEHWSLWLDLKILLMTIPAIFGKSWRLR